MKKLFSIMLSMALILSLTACGSEPETGKPDTSVSVSQDNSSSVTDPGPASTETSVSTDTQTNEELSELGAAILSAFNAEAASAADVRSLAEKMADASDSVEGPVVMVEEMQEGYMPGFSADVTGFKSAASFLPMIGSIPFAGYVFEADDPAAFLETIKGIADPRWNICTEAKETICEISGNYVLFVMTPGDEF